MKTPQEIIDDYAEEGARLRVSFFGEQAGLLDRIGFTLAKNLAAGGKVLICGNGGSAADAQHMSAELVGRYILERPALPAIALNVDTSILTSVGNDYGFDDIFARQVRALGRQGDVLVALSTSGNSPNVLGALRAAREIGLTTMGLTGKGGGLMGPLCDYMLDVPSQRTPLIQEVHGASIHILCHLVDYYLFENAAALQTAGPQGA